MVFLMLALDLFVIWCLKFGASRVPGGHFSATSIYSPPQFRHKCLLQNELTPETPNYSPLSQVLAPNGELFRRLARQVHDATSCESTTSAIVQDARPAELFTTSLESPVKKCRPRKPASPPRQRINSRIYFQIPPCSRFLATYSAPSATTENP
jgi:hypothetical protein